MGAKVADPGGKGVGAARRKVSDGGKWGSPVGKGVGAARRKVSDGGKRGSPGGKGVGAARQKGSDGGKRGSPSPQQWAGRPTTGSIMSQKLLRAWCALSVEVRG